jgi:hypothetical protein
VIGFDIERHDYGTGGYPGKLVIQDVNTLHGSQFKDAQIIVASPPCQAYSYRAMPWKRAKALPPPDNTLFEDCFRIQREASEAAGRYIPLIVENVRGAQKWVGRAKANFGSYYLWGDVGMVGKRVVAEIPKFGVSVQPMKDRKTPTGSWDMTRKNYTKDHSWYIDAQKRNPDGTDHGSGSWFAKGAHLTSQRGNDGRKQPGISGPRTNGKGDKWFQDGAARHGSKSKSRKAASAMIAKIPFPLAQYIARSFKELGN